MIETNTCINIYSDMNTWIDFCIVVSNESLLEAKGIIQKAYDDWWDLPDAEFEPISDYIGRCLKENKIDFEIYYKNNEEEVN